MGLCFWIGGEGQFGTLEHAFTQFGEQCTQWCPCTTVNWKIKFAAPNWKQPSRLIGNQVMLIGPVDDRINIKILLLFQIGAGSHGRCWSNCNTECYVGYPMGSELLWLFALLSTRIPL